MKVGQETDNKKVSTLYTDNYDHLADELRKLDLLIRRQVVALQMKNSAMPKAAARPGVYISHEEIEWMLCGHQDNRAESLELEQIRNKIEQLQREIDIRISASLRSGVFLAIPRLSRLFALSPFELQTVIICLAPELRRKYDKLYAYLQDDITRKKPSVDLVLDMLCETQADRWKSRTLLSDHAPLLRAGIIHKTDDPQSPSGSSDLAQFLKLDPRIVDYLLGNNNIDGRLSDLRFSYPSVSIDHILVDPAIKMQLLNLTQHHFAAQGVDRRNLILYFHGPYGVGKRDLALGICGRLNCPMLSLDAGLLLTRESDVQTTLQLAFRESLLQQAALYIDHADVLLREDDKARTLVKKLSTVVADYGWLTFLVGGKPWSPEGTFEGGVFQAVEFPIPGVPLREVAWRKALENLTPEPEAAWAGPLARQFRLTPGQIRDAVALAKNQRAMGDG
ncbi:MAG: AAA family ATPase, partial [Planctomycetota bacterium]